VVLVVEGVCVFCGSACSGVVEGEDADFDGEIEQRDSCTLRQSFDAINNAFITVRVTALWTPTANRQEVTLTSCLLSTREPGGLTQRKLTCSATAVFLA
jgi:hypothetical protein